jgi:hypothetical protein
MTIVAGILSACLGGCGGSSSSASTSATVRSTSTVPPPTATTTAATTHTSSSPPAPKRTQPSPGSLPQTNQLPSGATAAFQAEMDALWNGIRTGSVSAALRAFFPEGAYAQVKAIADPAADYNARLIGDYRLDITAAHALLGAHPSEARLLKVQVPGSYAHWVAPGVCYNRFGYYEVPNSRIVYSANGQTRSFGIASLISWRGVWYVVHLGAVVRAGAGGVVDDPSSGPGTSAPSSTC